MLARRGVEVIQRPRTVLALRLFGVLPTVAARSFHKPSHPDTLDHHPITIFTPSTPILLLQRDATHICQHRVDVVVTLPIKIVWPSRVKESLR